VFLHQKLITYYYSSYCCCSDSYWGHLFRKA